MIKQAKDLRAGDGVDHGWYIRCLVSVDFRSGGVDLRWDDGEEEFVTPGSEFANVVEAGEW